ncbi:mitochondrial inner membrane protease atp23 [Lasallia pustulata]|uniref:Mitochondrial inner membrane protease ATP23 n=1 Tax=Lasallia pustulata TaxID=136370 RepID=A0A1W5D8A8_9LECA|nr:mitochondrial inner membrane protease atp23 [Lasallia pustulata]
MADANASTSSEAKETGFTPGNDASTRWRNWFSLLTGKMTAEGKEQYRTARDDRMEEADCKRCEKQRDYLLQYSPIIRFMRENINQLGGDIHSGNIRCRRCVTRQTGGFDPNYGIQICANELRNRGHLEDTMAHEMVHAYDHLRFKLDWRDNLRHAACAEIRASSLSGECRWSREFFTRGQLKLTQQHQECVRRRAILSVAGRPSCKDHVQAAQAVNEVWESCFADTRPFDEIYR